MLYVKSPEAIRKQNPILTQPPLKQTVVNQALKTFGELLQCTSTKDAVDVITPSLTTLFNLSIQTRSFPSIWKTAKVIPLFEKSDKQDASNYRPISILPTLNKILEKAVHTQLYAYLTENNLISPNAVNLDLD